MGGGLHSFEENGFVFDSGLHYLSCTKDTKGLFRLMGSKDIEWVEYQHFDSVYFSNN